jgi:hypothetical protein
MRVWTNGVSHVARTSRGVFVLRGAQLVKHLEGVAKGEALGNDDVWAVSPSGVVAWFDGLARLALDTGEVTAWSGAAEVIDVAALGEDRVAAILGPAPTLAIGDPEGWEVEVLLDGKGAVNAVFPGLLWAEGAAPVGQDHGFGGGAGARRLRVSAGPHGVAVVARSSGLVAVLREGAREIDFVLRLPTQAEARIDAVATEQGVLVTVVLEGREGATCHFDREGRCVGSVGPTAASVPAARLAGGRFVLYDDTGSSGRVRVHDEVGGKDLHPRARLSLTTRPSDAAAAPDGRSVVFGHEGGLELFELGDKRLSHVETVAFKALLQTMAAQGRARAQVEQGAMFKRGEGPPAIGFPVSKISPVAWEAEEGGVLDLALQVRSTGGQGKGVVVELSGPALAEGLLEPTLIAIGEESAAPVKSGAGWVATLGKVPIPHGVLFPFDPKPKTPELQERAASLLAQSHLSLRVVFAARRLGSALLAVSARPLLSTAAPMKWTRPATVRGPLPPPGDAPGDP